MRPGTRKPDAVYVNVDLLVVKSHQTSYRRQLASGKVVGPGEIVIAVAHFLADMA